MIRALLAAVRFLETRVRVTWLSWRHVALQWPVRIDRGVDFAAGVCLGREHGPITSARGCHFSRGVVIHGYGGSVRLGSDVFLGPYSVIYGHGGVEIGDQTLVSMHCRILSSNHAIAPSDTEIRSQPDIPLPTKIGRDVWLGAGVTVLGGVMIGNGCVVGAGAVVTRDLPENSIAMGVPAKVVGTRK